MSINEKQLFSRVKEICAALADLERLSIDYNTAYVGIANGGTINSRNVERSKLEKAYHFQRQILEKRLEDVDVRFGSCPHDEGGSSSYCLDRKGLVAALMSLFGKELIEELMKNTDYVPLNNNDYPTLTFIENIGGTRNV